MSITSATANGVARLKARGFASRPCIDTTCLLEGRLEYRPNIVLLERYSLYGVIVSTSLNKAVSLDNANDLINIHVVLGFSKQC